MLLPTSVDGGAQHFSDLASLGVPAAVSPDDLARAVRQRRAELRMSQQDIRDASGLSITTIGKLERGGPDLIVQTATLRRLDLALQWQVGTAESWLAGHGGVVDTPTGVNLAAWVAELAPLVAAQLRAEREPPSTLSVAGLPEPVVAALEQLAVEIRAALR